MKSEAKRRADNKYDLKTYTVVGCKIKRSEAAAFKDRCTLKGTTPNQIFKEAIISFMKSTGEDLEAASQRYKVEPEAKEPEAETEDQEN